MMRPCRPKSVISSAWLMRRSLFRSAGSWAASVAASVSASATVRSEYSRMRRSSAARDSPSASFRPCLTSTLNQLSIPWLMNSSEDM